MPAISTSPTNGSATDSLLGFAGRIVDTIGAVQTARAAAQPPPPPAPTDTPRGVPTQTTPAPTPAPASMRAFPQWQLWLGGTIAIGGVISLALLALRRRPAG